MKDLIQRLGIFLHFIDDDGRLNLSDIAFIIIMGKIIVAPVLDFPSVITLATVILNKMQKRHVENNMAQDSEQVKEMTQHITDLKDKISPIIDQIKGTVK